MLKKKCKNIFKNNEENTSIFSCKMKPYTIEAEVP